MPNRMPFRGSIQQRRGQWVVGDDEAPLNIGGGSITNQLVEEVSMKLHLKGHACPEDSLTVVESDECLGTRKSIL